MTRSVEYKHLQVRQSAHQTFSTVFFRLFNQAGGNSLDEFGTTGITLCIIRLVLESPQCVRGAAEQCALTLKLSSVRRRCIRGSRSNNLGARPAMFALLVQRWARQLQISCLEAKCDESCQNVSSAADIMVAEWVLKGQI